jgi:hypothetical protein
VFALDHLINERYDSHIPDYFSVFSLKKGLFLLEKFVQEERNSLELFGGFYKVNCGVHLGFFLTHLVQKDV